MQGTLSHADIEDLLLEESFGHLACVDGKKPYIVPMAYVFHDNVLYGQTTEGRKVELLRKNPLVCFQVEQLSNGRWRSVMCWGSFEELAFEDLRDPESFRIVELLTSRIARIQDSVGISVPFSYSGQPAPMVVNDKKSTLFRIPVAEKTGRFFMTR